MAYYGSGCYNCSGWSTGSAAAAGAIVGMAAGAASLRPIPPPQRRAPTRRLRGGQANTTSAYNAGVATGVAAANPTGAYNAGVAAGVAAAGGPPAAYATNAIYPTLPAGAIAIPKNGTTYYLSGNTWFQPSFGANGVYYRVVPTP